MTNFLTELKDFGIFFMCEEYIIMCCGSVENVIQFRLYKCR